MINKSYNQVENSRDPNIIGIRDGSFQVELKWLKSFNNKEEREYYNGLLGGVNFDKFRFSNFPIVVDQKKINLPLKFYADKKSVKETDFVTFAYELLGLQLMVSEETLLIMKQFKLPPMIEIECQIIAKKAGVFEGKFYLLGFPYIDDELIDYSQSKFIYLEKNNGLLGEWKVMPEMNTRKEFISFRENEICALARPKTIHLKKTTEYDVINMRYHYLFFSKNLIDTLRKKKLIRGLDILDCNLKFD